MNSSEKLVYIYLITNEKTKPSGIYKVFIQDCSSRTGLKQKQVEAALNNLHKKKMVLMFESWAFITRFLRETFNLDKKILSPKIKKSIEKQFVNDRVPIEIISCFNKVYHALSIPYPYSIDTILDFRLEILEEITPYSPPLKINKELKIIFNKNTFTLENITTEHIERWKKVYPDIDIQHEILKASSWLSANKDKSYKNYERFLVGWLGRAKPVDRPPENPDIVL
jgi:hypothetical protein